MATIRENHSRPVNRYTVWIIRTNHENSELEKTANIRAIQQKRPHDLTLTISESSKLSHVRKEAFEERQ